jgi:hypothetical protein
MAKTLDALADVGIFIGLSNISHLTSNGRLKFALTRGAEALDV